jgi:hypothetical protein
MALLFIEFPSVASSVWLRRADVRNLDAGLWNRNLGAFLTDG